MVWTRMHPTQCGWYWVRQPGNLSPVVRYVYEGIAGNFLMPRHTSKMDLMPVIEFPETTEWAGPIPEPTEP